MIHVAIEMAFNQIGNDVIAKSGRELKAAFGIAQIHLSDALPAGTFVRTAIALDQSQAGKEAAGRVLLSGIASDLREGTFKIFGPSEIDPLSSVEMEVNDGVGKLYVNVSNAYGAILYRDVERQYSVRLAFETAVERLEEFAGYNDLTGCGDEIRNCLRYIRQCWSTGWLGDKAIWAESKHRQVSTAFERLLKAKRPADGRCNRHRDAIYVCIDKFDAPEAWMQEPPVWVERAYEEADCN